MRAPASGSTSQQFLVKACQTSILQLAKQLLLELWISGGVGANSPGEDFHVKTRSPDDQGRLTPALKRFDHGPCELRIACRVEGLIRVGHIEKMVRDERALFGE